MPGRPGISGAAIDFDFTQDGGQAKVRIANGALDLPGVFEDSLVPFDQLAVDAQWKFSGRKIEAQLRNLQFANADAQGEAQVTWRTEDVAGPAPAAGMRDHRFPGVLDLQGSLSRGDGTRVHRYLPLVLPDPVRHYVRDAVVQGQVSDVKFKVKGPLEHLPFTNPAQGDFRVSAKIRNGHFAYVPKTIQPAGAAPWPALTELGGELVFNRAALEVNGASGKVAGLPGLQLVKGEARIPDLTHNSTVNVNCRPQGCAGRRAGLRQPVAGGRHDQPRAGRGHGHRHGRLPLPPGAAHPFDRQIRASRAASRCPATTCSSRRRRPCWPSSRAWSTSASKAFPSPAARPNCWAAMCALTAACARSRARTGSAETETVATFKAQGNVTAEGLRQARELGPLARMAQNATGSTAYTATLGFRRGMPELTVISSLQGMALNLPAPLNKTADAALPLRFENALLQASMAPGQKLEDQMSVSVGRAASIVYVRDLSGAEPRVLRGGIAVGLEPGETVPHAGVRRGGQHQPGPCRPRRLAEAAGRLRRSAARCRRPRRRRPRRSTAPPRPPAMSYLPTTMAIRAKELVVEGRKLNNVVVGGSREGLTWRANIDATELNGYVEFRQPAA